VAARLPAHPSGANLERFDKEFHKEFHKGFDKRFDDA
jgi:hypothetical protein